MLSHRNVEAIRAGRAATEFAKKLALLQIISIRT
jgi:hypothetical protein